MERFRQYMLKLKIVSEYDALKVFIYAEKSGVSGKGYQQRHYGDVGQGM